MRGLSVRVDLPELRESHLGNYALHGSRFFQGFTVTLRDLPKLERLVSEGWSFQWVESAILEGGRGVDG